MKKNFVLLIIGGLILAIGLFALYLWGAQSLWNWLIPEIFNGPEVSYWQMAGLMLLVCMFSWVAGHGWWGPRPHRKHHMKHQEHWKSKWDKKWCNMTSCETKEENKGE